MPVNEFIQTRILDPLDMKDTYFIVPEDQLHRISSAARGKIDLKGSSQKSKAISRDSSALVSVSGGLFSTVRDYLRFQKMLMNKGILYGQRILSAETVDLMISNQVGDLKENVAKGGPNRGTGFTIALVMGIVGST